MSATVATCAHCGRAYRAAEFARLHYVGVQPYGIPGLALILRDCACTSGATFSAVHNGTRYLTVEEVLEVDRAHEELRRSMALAMRPGVVP